MYLLKFLQHVSWPKDFGNPKPKGSQQTQLIDDLSMSLDDSLHNNDNNNYKYKTNAAVPSAGFSKEQKRQWAKASEADRKQQARVQANADRSGSTKSLKEIYDDVKLKNKKEQA